MKSSNISDASTVLRIEMKRAQLKSYSPRSTVSIFSGVLNRHITDGDINDISHIGDYTPFIHNSELNALVKDFEKIEEISIIQDSTHLYDEQFAICARGIDDSLWVKQRLIGMWSTNHHLKGLNMSFIIEKALDRLKKERKNLIAMSADRVSANNVAYKDLVSQELKLMIIGCFSHTLDKVGKKFDAPELKKFMITVRLLLSNSSEAKRVFRSLDSNEKDLAGYAAIRWWNDWIQQVQIFNMGIEKILTLALELKNNDKCSASSGKLIELMEDKKSLARLSVQISASIDYAKPFCKATFNLEGDADGLAFVTGGEIKKCYERISSMNINIDRLKSGAKNASIIVEPLVREIKERLSQRRNSRLNVEQELANSMEMVDASKIRKEGEGEVLLFGDKVTMKRRVRHSQVQGVVTCVYFNEVDGTVQYDITPSNGANHLNVSEFELVKSAGGDLTRVQRKETDMRNLDLLTAKNKFQTDRLADLSRLQEASNNNIVRLRDAEVRVEEIEAELASFGPISIDE